MSNFTLVVEEEEVHMKKLPILFSKKCPIDYTHIHGRIGLCWLERWEQICLHFAWNQISVNWMFTGVKLAVENSVEAGDGEIEAEWVRWKGECMFVGLAYYQGKDIVFRFIIEYSSLRDFYRLLGNNNNNNNRSIFMWGFLKDDILACVETWH
jgi:hypothetical protein